jgi:hypothetical protein
MPEANEQAPKKAEASIKKVKSWLDILQSLVTIAAILAGGIWFMLQRSTKPEVKIEHMVTQRPVDGSIGMWLVAIEVRVTNVGKVKVDLGQGIMNLSQVNPVPGSELVAADLRDLRLEPGESDQALFRTYQIPETVKTIQVHSRYEVPGAHHLYWNLLSLADIGKSPTVQSSASSGD